MEVNKFQVFIVKEGNPAYEAIMRHFTKRQLKEGKILPVSDQEFDKFKNDFIRLEVQKGNKA